LDPEPVPGVPPVYASGQGGLLDIALHPEFATNRLLYLSRTKASADGLQSTESVVRGRFDGQQLTDVEEIFEAQAWSTRPIAIASRLAFDRDGYLFFTVGDRATPTVGDLEAHVAQDLTTHMGKTVRLHDDGRVPADNPFVGRADALPDIWTYGHRNAQGMAVHPGTGDLWQSEHAAQGGDELNILRRGGNYGWPVIGYGGAYGAPGGARPLHVGTARDGMEQPIHHWTPSISPSGIMIYAGERFPRWRGNIFVAALAGERLIRVVVDGSRYVREDVLLEGTFGRLRDVRESPDGDIYLTADGRAGGRSSLVRLEPAN
jgi:glucose/arabinose dehydrogenase